MTPVTYPATSCVPTTLVLPAYSTYLHTPYSKFLPEAVCDTAVVLVRPVRVQPGPVVHLNLLDMVVLSLVWVHTALPMLVPYLNALTRWSAC